MVPLLALACAASGPSILFGVVTDHSSSSLSRLKANMAIVSFWPARMLIASWAVVVFNNQTAEWHDLYEYAALIRTKLLMLEDADRLTRAKFYYQDRFAALLHRMLSSTSTPLPRYIWLVDHDISFERFRMDRFLQSWACSFASGPPLISQPVVLENTQTFWHVNWESWQHTASYPTIARETTFVEMQVPLVEVDYFLHLDAGVGRRILEHGLQLVNDWGYDLVWCRQAQLFMPSRVACAVVPTPISHQNTKSLHKDDSYAKHGELIKQWLMHKYPHLYHFPDDLTTWHYNTTMRNASIAKLLAPLPPPPSWEQCVVSTGAALEPVGVLSNLHVYWINGDPRRREYMERQFVELGISANTRVQATLHRDLDALLANGFNVSEMIISRHVASNVRDSYHASPEERRSYSPGELGCTISHLRAARMALEAQHALSLIIEDDLDLSTLRSSPYTLAELAELAPPNARLLQLHVNNAAQHRKWCNSSVAFWPWQKEDWSSAAYLLTRDGAVALASSIPNPDAPEFARGLSDFLSKYFHEPNVKSPLVADHLIYHANEPHAYSFSRPVFRSAPFTDTSIQSAEVNEILHKPLAQYLAEYYRFSGMSHCASLKRSVSHLSD